MKRLFLFLMAGLLASCGDDSQPTKSALPYPMISEQGRISTDMLACRAFKDFERLQDFAAARDKAAFTKFALAKQLAGQCETLAANRIIVVEDTGIMSGSLCVRPVGEIDCLWLTNRVVKKLDSP